MLSSRIVNNMTHILAKIINLFSSNMQYFGNGIVAVDYFEGPFGDAINFLIQRINTFESCFKNQTFDTDESSNNSLEGFDKSFRNFMELIIVDSMAMNKLADNPIGEQIMAALFELVGLVEMVRVIIDHPQVTTALENEREYDRCKQILRKIVRDRSLISGALGLLFGGVFGISIGQVDEE